MIKQFKSVMCDSKCWEKNKYLSLKRTNKFGDVYLGKTYISSSNLFGRPNSFTKHDSQCWSTSDRYSRINRDKWARSLK